MLRRGLAFSSFMCLATVVRAGAVVDVVPDKACYVAGVDTTATVDIKLHQSPVGADHYLRFTQLDFATNDSNMKGRLSFPLTHLAGGNPDIFGWLFTGTGSCVNSTDATCGQGHFLEVPMCASTSPNPGKYCTADADCGGALNSCLGKARSSLMSRTYYFTNPANLGTNTTDQVLLKGDGTAVTVARVTISLSGLAANDYALNVIDAAQANPDLGGGDVRYGFGPDAPAPADPVTKLRAPTDLTGGTGTIHVATICDGGVNVHLVSSDPTSGHSLWRSAKNIIRLRFSGVINALPVSSDILVREMTGTNPTCGTFNASLTSGNFTFALGGICTGGARAGKLCGHNADCTQNVPGDLGVCTLDNMTLTIQESATTLVHRKWYEVSSAGWSNVDAFGGGPTVVGTPNAQFVLQVGDVNDDGKVQTNDAGAVYPKVPCVANCGDNRREDVNGDLKIQTNDAGIVYPKVPSLAVPKPCGH
ncbi:MAG: hypothetical protein HY287_17395 [Planctomycetes bacterium]|nr:hypothetical protein [Planctomycetota bacterium]MBI3836102.1 hypothetical protein [Planctomycetota bacterium]